MKRKLLFIIIFIFSLFIISCNNVNVNPKPSEETKQEENKGNVLLEETNNGFAILSSIGETLVGTKVTITIVPIDGYELDKIYLNDILLEGNEFTVSSGDNIVKVTFKEIEDDTNYGNVSLGKLENGYASLSSNGKVEVGTVVNIIPEPDQGYEVGKAYLNGKELDGLAFTVIEGINIVTVDFVFVDNTKYGNVSLGEISNGQVFLSKCGEVIVGESIHIDITPNEGYELDKIYINGNLYNEVDFFVSEGEMIISVTFKEIEVIKELEVFSINSKNFNLLDFVTLTNVIPNTSYPNEFTFSKGDSSLSSNKISGIEKIEVIVYGSSENLMLYDKINDGTKIDSNVSDSTKYNSAKCYTYELNSDEFIIKNSSTTYNSYVFEINIYYSGTIDGSLPYFEEEGIIDINSSSLEKDSRIEYSGVSYNNEELVFSSNGYIKSKNINNYLNIVITGSSDLRVFGIKSNNEEVLIEGANVNIGEGYDGFIIRNNTNGDVSVSSIYVTYNKRIDVIDVSISEAVSIASALNRNKGISTDIYRLTGVITSQDGTQIRVEDNDGNYIIAYSASVVEHMNLGFTVTLVGKLENYYSKMEIVEYYVESYIEIKYNIEVKSCVNGIIEASKTSDLSYGETIEVTALPDDGYLSKYLYVNGIRYKFNNNLCRVTITTNCTLYAEFVLEGEDNPPIGSDVFVIHSLEMMGTYGDCNLIQYGSYDILIDAGTASDTLNMKAMLASYVTDGIIDLIIVSHPDSDHYTGIVNGGLEGMEVERLIVNNSHNENEKIKDAVRKVDSDVIIELASVLTNETNMVYTIEVDDYFSVDIMYNSYYSGTGKNNASIPAIINYKNTKLFMGGDMENASCTSFMEKYPNLFNDEDYVMFKILHHGSNGSNSSAFLQYLKPDFAFVCAPLKTDSALNPSFNTHPYLQAMIRVGEVTTDVYWAGLCGNLTISCDGTRAIAQGEGRSRDYKYKDGSELVMASRIDEIDISYFESKWYLQAIINLGAPDYAGIHN